MCIWMMGKMYAAVDCDVSEYTVYRCHTIIMLVVLVAFIDNRESAIAIGNMVLGGDRSS